MRFRFNSTRLEKLYYEERGARKYPPSVVDSFFEVMALISNAKDERELYAMKSLHYEKLKGRRKHQRSVRLNDQFRLLVEKERDAQGRYLLIIDIEDYH